jgi:hypothetical protein
MPDKYKETIMKTVEYDGKWCFTVQEQAEALIQEAKRLRCTVTHEFNGVTLKAIPNGGHAGLIVEYYQARCKESSARYEAEKLAHDNTPEGQEELRIKEEKERKRKALLAEPIKKFKLKDKKAWDKAVNNNHDPYGKAAVTYAARWAWMMEQKLEKGEKLIDIAEQTSRDADAEGITGFMYGCAVSVLSHVWVHGEELRQWHNKDTQIGDEGDKANETGGVLNPALVRIGK